MIMEPGDLLFLLIMGLITLQAIGKLLYWWLA